MSTAQEGISWVNSSSPWPRAEALRVKILALRRPDICTACAQPLEAGTKAAWEATTRTVRCLPCSRSAREDPPTASLTGLPVQELPETPPVVPAPMGPPAGAGSSAQREYQRRSERRETAVRTRHPRLGGLLLALFDEPSSTRVWAQGASGERAVAAKLDELAGEHLIALHDRKMLRPAGRASRANIDHLVVTAAGVWVIDAKTHKGSLELRRSGGLFSPRIEKLFINGRDRTSLLEGLARQVDCVRAVLREVDSPVPVASALCFVGTELPWFGASAIGGVPLVGRRGLGKLMKQPGELTAADRSSVAEFLDRRFVPA